MGPAQFIVASSFEWERREYFDYYFNQIKCKYTLNANIDISHLLEVIKAENKKFFPTFLYAIMRAVNQNKEFRMSFDEGELGFWNYVNPSYTVFHEDDKTFSDIWSEYDKSYSVFYQNVMQDIATYRDEKGIRTKANRTNNFCPISAIPWLNYTSFSQDTYSESKLLFPLIKFGKYAQQGNKTEIPFSVFVNHAVADGYHTCKLINDVQSFVDNCQRWIKS